MQRGSITGAQTIWEMAFDNAMNRAAVGWCRYNIETTDLTAMFREAFGVYVQVGYIIYGFYYMEF